MSLQPTATKLAVAIFISAITACGGGGGEVAGTSTVLEGSIVKGPVAGATVTAYRLNQDGSRGGAIASVVTNASGAYSIVLPAMEGLVMIEAVNGTFDDEATPGADSTPLTVPLRSVTAVTPEMRTAALHATPLTEVIVRRATSAAGGLNGQNVAAALTSVAAEAGLVGKDLFKSRPDVAAGTSDPYGKLVIQFAQAARSANLSIALETYTKAVPPNAQSPATTAPAPTPGTTGAPTPAPTSAPAPAPASAPAPAPTSAPAPAPAEQTILISGGLTWSAPVARYDWPAANNYCNTQLINGSTGWRLPTIFEMQNSMPSFDKMKIVMEDGTVPFRDNWSSTPFELSSGAHWFSGMYVLSNDNQIAVMCVKPV